MPIIEIPRNLGPIQIDVPESFPKRKGEPKTKEKRKIKRSREGSIHLKPGVQVLTADEMDFLAQTNRALHSRLRFVALTADEKAKMKPEEKKLPPVRHTPPPPEPSRVPSSPKGAGSKRGD